MKLARRAVWEVVATVLSCRDDLCDMVMDSSALWRLFSMRAGVLTDSWRTCVCDTFIFLMKQLGPQTMVCVPCV